MKSKFKAFTIVEFLIAVGVVALMIFGIIVIINPREGMRNIRDTIRLSDLTSLEADISKMVIETGESVDLDGPYNHNTCYGESNQTIYLSLVDPTSSSCQGLINKGELSPPPPGWKYHCVISEGHLRDINGQGWIPLDFFKYVPTPLSGLPVDPVNSAKQNLYYEYICHQGNGFELNLSRFESEKFVTQCRMDGGDDPYVYERGMNLNLFPLSRDVIACYRFDESKEQVAVDSSEYKNHGTLFNTLDFIAGKFETALNLDGIDSYALVSEFIIPESGNFTISFWIYPFDKPGRCFMSMVDKNGQEILSCFRKSINFILGVEHKQIVYPEIPALKWTYFVLQRKGNHFYVYINGKLKGTIKLSSPLKAKYLLIGASPKPKFFPPQAENYFYGLIDEFRIYNTVLSPEKIRYNYLIGR